MQDISQLVYITRIRKGLSQLDLARRAHVPQPNLSNLEKGKRDVTLSTFLRICGALGVSPAEFFAELEKRPGKHALSLTRTVLERIAEAVVHRRVPTRPGEREMAALFMKLVPESSRRRIKKSEVYRSWYEVRRLLNDQEIRALFQRIQDARQRAA